MTEALRPPGDRGGSGIQLRVASIVLHDAQGTPRLKLEVDKGGKTRTVGLTPAPESPQRVAGAPPPWL
ncbi:hypothetical protein [Corallococcus sp. 4LFB]|uniref:hypothetical protein n=1 Tax=Corallococcus sp. 4LFB TaxID=3383249 RepID=UPI003975D468